MTLRPKQFYLVSACMLFAAISFPFQVAWLYGHSLTEVQSIFAKLTHLNWLVLVSLLMGAYLYFQASRWIIIFAPIMLAIISYNNYQVGAFGGDFSLLQTTLASMGAGILFLPLFMPSSRAILRNPQRRWWRISKRHTKKVSATLNPFVGEMIQAQTYDLSQTGVFLALKDEDLAHCPKVGDTVRLSFNVSPMKKIRCEARVVRVAEPQGRYPMGIGLRFVEFDKSHQKSYSQFLTDQSL
jgi:hypothetical protein